MAETNEKVIMLRNVRITFPVLFEAKSFNDDANGKKDFSASFLIPKGSPAIAELKAALTATAIAKWADKGQAMLNNLFRDDRLCLHDGDRKDYEGYAGCYFLRASNQVRPLVIDRARNPITEADGKIYSGCYVNATITLWAQDNKFGRRINANLRGVQFHADGDAFSGGNVAKTDEFEAAPEEAASLDSLGF